MKNALINRTGDRKKTTQKNWQWLTLCLLLSLIAQALVSMPAQASCKYGSEEYETGDTRGPYTCMPDGTWQ